MIVKRTFLILVLFSLITSCGFSPLYSNKSNKNFSIKTIGFQGDKTINNYVKLGLKQYQNNNFDNGYDIIIDTKFSKNILAKDKTAKITSYKLINSSTIQINQNGGLIKKIEISQNNNMNSYDDKFEERKVERNIKQNFATKILRDLIGQMSILNDN